MNVNPQPGVRSLESPINNSVGALLRRLIDFAGLFPPASLEMTAAVANYDRYLVSEHHWVLGRFILPAARLGEFTDAFCQLRDRQTEKDLRWRLSVLLGADSLADLASICERNTLAAASLPSGKYEVESVEAKAANPGDIARLSRMIPPELETYFEIPLPGASAAGLTRDCIAAVADCGRGAKIRTGGETADKFPEPEAVVDFMRMCAAFRVPFRATAGLHHPLRSRHRLTYRPDSPSGVMHGFLNVFLAAVFLRMGMDITLAAQLLEEQSSEVFHFGADEIVWRDIRVGIEDISDAREHFAISFGSCSFTEPIADLRSMSLL